MKRKNRDKYLLMILLAIEIISCSQKSRLNLPDNQLKNDIEHPDSALSVALVADLDNFPLTKPKNGQQFHEIRANHAGSLPVIDLTGNSQPIRPLMLSQVAGTISYLKIKYPKCSGVSSTSVNGGFCSNHNYENTPMGVVKTNNNIILNGLQGIFLYSKEGVFLDTLYRNKVYIFPSQKNMFMFTPLRVVFNKPIVDEAGGKIYLNEMNGETHQNRILEFRADFLNSSIINKTLKEKRTSPLQLNRALKLDRHADQIELISPNVLVSHTSSMDDMKKRTNIMATLSSSGDTLCAFHNALPFKPFVSGMYRSPESRKSYQFNHQYTVKQEYNDTIFRMIPPNHLLPCYVFNFGDRKLSAEVAYNPKINIDGTIHVEDFIETQNYIILKLVLGYDCPNTRKEGKVHFRGAYYDKRSRQVFYLPGKGTLPDDFNLPNDIDGGLPFWPREMTDNGEMISWIDGKTMKQTLTNEWFAKSSAPQNRKLALQEYLKTVEDDDTVIITVK